MKHKKGITLIEVLVTIGLTSTIVYLVVYSLINGLQSSEYNYNRFKISSSLDSALNDISKYLLLANNLPNSLIYDGEEYINDSDTLIINLPSIHSDGSVINSFFDSIIYDYNPNDNQVRQLVLPNSESYRNYKNNVILSDVSSVTFNQNLTSKGVVENINISIDSTSFGKNSDYSLSRSVRMRNQ
ncbi:MAG: hypothetical protein UR93_C0012G0009 [Berkelbacteria bacterium GW2011_GWA2_35_9]|uniref:Prepilin-type N-terminal cleavage/methylation domain-containing protein n=1 Tax=Berkelbacteria bacterium GW2011_GWA2_35_9 TaxID=1618333 RepID=A0A0G0DIA3_9BACT|nr:MAG: hypothetical protein UR93_C0012G0009 [Berkelbacteria bacterium GW2011_GWA2_35_9]